MVSAVSQGVRVSVVSEYLPDYSQPEQNKYVFTYRVYIVNESPYTVQLLRRRWQIFDGIGSKKVVEGPGVVGQQPVLEPGARYEYVSGCQLEAPIGMMRGTYQMTRQLDGGTFLVTIPDFTLIATFLLN